MYKKIFLEKMAKSGQLIHNLIGTAHFPGKESQCTKILL
jgi:hypothetical protein